MEAFRAPAGASRLILGVLLVAVLGACPNLPHHDGPAFEVRTEYFAGSILTGPLPAEVDFDIAPWALEIRLLRVDSFIVGEGEDLGQPISARALQVFAEPAADPLKPHSELAVGSRGFGGETPLRNVVSEQSFTAALWPGSAVRFLTSRHPGAEHSDTAPWTGFGWRISRPNDGSVSIDVAILFEGWIQPESDGLDDDPPPAFLQHEGLVFAGAQLITGETIRVVLPAPRPGRPHAAEVLEARLRLNPANTEIAFARAKDRGRAAILASQELARVQAGAPAANSEYLSSRMRALEMLSEDPLQRPAMLYLANSGGAAAAEQLVMVASDSLMTEFTARILKRLENEELAQRTQQSDAFGWFLERQAYFFLAGLDADPSRDFPAELVALMLTHTGELGRYSDLVVETIRASTDFADAQRRIVAENRIYLQDSHPGSRVRAYDWLRRRGEAPEGYDPLAPITERRAALEAQEETP